MLLDNAFSIFYTDILSNNASYVKKLTEKAKNMMEIKEDDMMFKIALSMKMKDIAMEEFKSGEILNSKEIGRAAAKITMLS